MTQLNTLHEDLSGSHFIEASAGTGKTYAIGLFTLRLLLEEGLNIDQILIVTFTEAATHELQSRIRDLIHSSLTFLNTPGNREAPQKEGSVEHYLQSRPTDALKADIRQLRQALLDFDNARISTIHGFCNRIISERAFDLGNSFEGELVASPEQHVTHLYKRLQHKHLFQGKSKLFIKYLAQNKNRIPDTSIIMRILETEDLQIAPPTFPKHDEADLLNHLQQLQHACQTSWADLKPVILEVLFDGTPMHRTWYQADTVKNAWVPLIETIVKETPTHAKTLFEHHHRLFPASIKKNAGKGKRVPTHPFFEDWKALFDLLDQLGEHLETLRILTLIGLINELRSSFREYKKKWQIHTYTDMIHGLAHALDGPRSTELINLLRQDYHAVLIDEFQDTDPIQYKIFQKAFGHGHTRLFFIGDPKQSIYAFRGADIHTYTHASTVHKKGHVTLTTNWRSDPALLGAFNLIFSKPEQPFCTSRIDYQPVKPNPSAENKLTATQWDTTPVQILECPKKKKGSKEPLQFHLPSSIANEIALLLSSDARIADRAVQPSDIAILCRNNSQAKHMKDALHAANIPAVLHSDESVFSSSIAGETHRLLRALANPYKPGLLKAALSSRFFSISQEDFIQLVPGAERYEQWMTIFKECHVLWTKRGIASALFSLHDQGKLTETLANESDSLRLITDYQHLIEMTAQACHDHQLSPNGALDWFSSQLEMAQKNARPSEPHHQTRLSGEPDAVNVMTIHKSKGLEFGIVFCPHLTSSSPKHSKGCFFTTSDGDHQRMVSFQSPLDEAHKQLAELAYRQEETRLFYVALTRAKHQCLLIEQQSARSKTFQVFKHFLSDFYGPNSSDGMTNTEHDALVHTRPITLRVGPSYNNLEKLPIPHENRFTRTLTSKLPVHSFSSFTSGRLEQPHSAADSKRIESRLAQGQIGPLASAPDSEHQNKDDTELLLASFPAGARAGLFFHDIFENLPSFSLDDDALRRTIQDSLQKYHFELEWEDTVHNAYRQILSASINDSSSTFTLANLVDDNVIHELEFLFPLHADSQLTGDIPTLPHPVRKPRTHEELNIGLSKLLSTHEPTVWPPGYAESVRKLSATHLTGHMKGFIDLTFKHEGRWFIADYKSNFLGHHINHYQKIQLQSAMAHHHYYLQYLFYTVALHRHLMVSVPDYSLQRDFGGVYYFFLRGMAQKSTMPAGVFFHRPCDELIEDLSNLLGGDLQSKGETR